MTNKQPYWHFEYIQNSIRRHLVLAKMMFWPNFLLEVVILNLHIKTIHDVEMTF